MPTTNSEILSSCDDGGPATPNPVQSEVSWSSAGGLKSGHATQRLSADNKSVKRSILEHCEGDEDLEKSVDTSKIGESECERGSSIMTWREHGGTVHEEP
ncbi:hypothetical protein Bca4012_080547 [Brassica carinata]